MLRLRKWQVRSRVHNSIDCNLAQAMAELDRLSDKLHIPPTIKEKAAIIYRKALNQGLVRGRSISAITAASLYATCRMTQTPRTLREITRVSTIDKKDIARCYRLMLRELSIQMPIPDAQLGVPKIAAKVGVGEKTQQKAVEILRRAEKLKTTAGKDPMRARGSYCIGSYSYYRNFQIYFNIYVAEFNIFKLTKNNITLKNLNRPQNPLRNKKSGNYTLKL